VTARSNTPGPLPGEFDLIARYFAPIAAAYPGALGLKDDVALLDLAAGHRMAVTTDAIVAGTHFLPDDPPQLIAKKLVRVNVSDLAAKGAKPLGCLLVLALPRGTTASWLDAFAKGLAEDCSEFGIPLVGGDTTATDGALTLALTALGEVPAGKALLRSGAKVGDRIFVTGTIGDAALGLEVAKGGLNQLAGSQRDYLLGRYRVPEPKLKFGLAVRDLAHAAIDVSDGLVADLGHICETSNVGAEIQAAMVPMSDAVQIAVSKEPDLLSRVLGGGDDYEILFTANPEQSDRIVELGISVGVPVTGIGFIVPATAESRVRVADLKTIETVLRVAGYRHF
jgi:thiamine-monophosphate kinase